MTLFYLILYWTLDIDDNFELLVPASNPLKHKQIKVFQVVLFCALHLLAGHYKHFEYGCKSVFYNPHIYCYEQVVAS